MKRINFDDGKFVADGRTFYLKESLTIERFMAYERIQTSMAFNLTFKQVFDTLKDVYELINSNKILDGGIKVYNLMAGIADKVDGKLHPALEICALFIIEEGEDTTVYDEAVTKSKIAAWKKEGFEMQDFFSLAVALVQGFSESYIDFTENISKELTVGNKKKKSITTKE